MLDERERTVYEKLLLAHYLHLETFDGQKHRRTMDDCLDWLLSPEDRDATAYLQYDLLHGRGSEDFIAYVKEKLGVTDDDSARAALFEKYRDRFEEKLARVRERGR